MAIIAIAAMLTGIMGIKAPRGLAVAFGSIDLQGMGRATLTVDQTAPVPDEGTSVAMEVFARMVYASELSQFKRGLYIRATFTIPSTRETGVLVVDVDRAGGNKDWSVGQTGLKARFYTLATRDAHGVRFDGVAQRGSLSLDASVVGATRAGFRINGAIGFADAGDDGIAGTDDDEAYDVDIELESVPPPEEINGQTVPPPPTPTGGVCDPTWCWQDDGYYDGYWYGPGCGDAEVGYETTDGGCASDTTDDEPVIDDGTGGGGTYDPYTPTTTSSDSGCDSSTTDDGSSSSGGCDGTDDTSGTSSDGCDGGNDSSSSSSGCSDSGSSSSSGCSDSSSGSGCGSSGCEGDTLQRAPAAQTGGLKGDLGWVAIVMFFGSLGAAVRRRDD
ncbi:MAG: hypothetical protein U1F43_14335 [Myxococcota bacterium]